MYRNLLAQLQKNKNLFIVAFIALVTVVYALLFFNLIDRHSVNVIFWDQWDFNDSLFGSTPPSMWEMFARQHGPHRQGIGAFVNLFIGWATDWNMRAEAFAIWGILVSAAVAAIYLKYRLFEKLTLWDALIPAVCLSFIQYEIAFPNTNPGYTALPLLFIILAGIVLTIKDPVRRYVSLAVINFFAVFTGFAFFLGIVVPPLLVLAAIFHRRGKEQREMWFALGAFAFSMITLALFFMNFQFAAGAGCFQFPHLHISEYLVFISNMLTMCQGFIFGYKATFARGFGMIVFGILVLILLWHFRQMIKTRLASPASTVIFTFFSFSIVYAVNTAIGRFCLGTDYARSTRYMTLLIPGWLALYFAILLVKSSVARTLLLVLFLILFVVMPARQYRTIDRQSTEFTEGRRKWVACYRELENIDECDRVSGIKVYPNAEVTNLKTKLDLLKARRYNLFSEP